VPAEALVRERLTDVVGHLAAHGQQLRRGAGAGPRDGGLQHVARAVELVPEVHVVVARPLPRPPEGGVQITVGVLRPGDHRGEGGEALVVAGAAGARRLPAHGLGELVDLGVAELPATPNPPVGLGEVAGPAESLGPFGTVVY